MRVALISHYFAPHIGGVENLVAEQAAGLRSRGCEVEVLTSRLRGDAALEIRAGVTVRRYRAVDLLSRINVPVPIVSPLMMLQIRNGNYDVIVAHGHCYLSSVYVSLAARSPYVLWQSNPFVEYGRALNFVERFVDVTIGKWVARRADRVAAISHHVAEYVSTFHQCDVEVVHPGVDTSVFKSHPRQQRRPDEKVTVRTMRRLVPRQGIDVLIRAWIEADLGGRAVLEIGGSGPERRALEKLAEGDSSIKFLGRIQDDEVVSFYVGCELFVLPTISGEGYGLVAAEALSCGRPVIATRSGGPAEIIREGVDGLLVEPNDAQALGRAISELVNDEDLRARMTVAASGRNLSKERGHDATLILLREIIGGG